jgi:hypothetical protein
MNDFEQQLKAARLAVPSDQLDRRMDDLFRAAVAAVPDARRASSRWWFLGVPAAAAIGLHLLVLSLPWSPRAPVVAPIVCQVEPAGLMRALLLTPPAAQSAPPVLQLSVRL